MLKHKEKKLIFVTLRILCTLCSGIIYLVNLPVLLEKELARVSSKLLVMTVLPILYAVCLALYCLPLQMAVTECTET